MRVERMMRVQRKIEGDIGRWQRVLGLHLTDDGRPVRRVGVPDFGVSPDLGLPPPSAFDTESPTAPGERAEPIPLPPGLDFTMPNGGLSV